MKPIRRNISTDISKLNEEELTKRLFIITAITIGLIITVILSFTVFAPTFGSLFKIFSKKGFGNELVIKPNAPVLTQVPSATKENKITLNGYGQSGTTIKIFVNGPEKGSTVTGGDGKFTFDNVELIQGRNTVFIKAIDSKNNESDSSSTYTITMDNDAPKIEILSPKKDEVIRNLDKRVTVKGKLNEKSILIINGQTSIVKSDLTFEHVIGVEEGNVEIKIKAIDEAGNEKEEILKVRYQKSSN
jgi:hypothetical protein